MFNKILNFFNKTGKEAELNKGAHYFKTYLDFVRKIFIRKFILLMAHRHRRKL